GRHAAADFPCGIQVQHLIEGENVLRDRPCNRQVIRSCPDVSVNLAGDACRLRENDRVTFDMSANVDALPEDEEVPLDRAVDPRSRASYKKIGLNGFIFE